MRSSRRAVTAALASVVVAGVAAAPGSAASPGGNAEVQAARVFALDARSGFDRVEVHLAQRRGAVRTRGSAGGVDGAQWRACVFAWTAHSFMSGCAEPTGMRVDVEEGSATGRLRFTLRDDFWGDTAVVDLALHDAGGPPVPTWSAPARADGLRVSSQPSAVLVRAAAASGSVVVTTRRGTRTTTRRHVVGAPARVQVGELVSAGVSAGA